MRFMSIQYSKIRVRTGLRPGPAVEAYRAPQIESLADFKGAALRFMGMEKRAMEGRGGAEREGPPIG